MRRRWLAGAVLLALAGCNGNSQRPPILEGELHWSEPQKLVLENDGSVPVQWMAAGEGPAVTLAPGTRAETSFAVLTVAELEKSTDGPWLRPRRAVTTDYLYERSVPPRLQKLALAFEIVIATSTQPHKITQFSFLRCGTEPSLKAWSEKAAPPKEHLFKISDVLAQLAGIALPICP